MPADSLTAICSLEEAVQFENPDVVRRFCDRFDVNHEQAEYLFIDVKQWLWLTALSLKEAASGMDGVPERMVIDTQMLIVDQAWHNFICFTRVYQEYCERHFGRIIHHQPTTEAQRKGTLLRFAEDPGFQRREKRIQCNYIYDKLGESVLTRWYIEYPKLYTPEVILRLRKV